MATVVPGLGAIRVSAGLAISTVEDRGWPNCQTAAPETVKVSRRGVKGVGMPPMLPERKNPR